MYFHLWKSISRCLVCHAPFRLVWRRRKLPYGDQNECEFFGIMRCPRWWWPMNANTFQFGCQCSSTCRNAHKLHREKLMLLLYFRLQTAFSFHYILTGNWKAVSLPVGFWTHCKLCVSQFIRSTKRSEQRVHAETNDQNNQTHSFYGTCRLAIDAFK